MSLHDAREIVRRAKSEYQRALRNADSHLRSAVSQDPARLDEAAAIQAEYATGFTSQQLGALVQPPPPKKDANGEPVYPPQGPAFQPPPPTVTLTIDGKAIAEATVPHIAEEAPRQDLGETKKPKGKGKPTAASEPVQPATENA